uniref:ATP synthase complex subunit 8 n=1 Tax=Pedicia sp. ZK-2016 TaxID=1808012 RepID=A0A192U5Z5_9DIPT|nr:ATP synthase F0 subunit 8 [Pedicia sp. ZK-2016]
MPQMAPLSWLGLFIIFSITLIIFSTMNYFSFLPNSPKTMNNKKKFSYNSLNWKW